MSNTTTLIKCLTVINKHILPMHNGVDSIKKRKKERFILPGFDQLCHAEADISDLGIGGDVLIDSFFNHLIEPKGSAFVLQHFRNLKNKLILLLMC